MFSELLQGFSGTERVFAAFAFMGTLFFVLRALWMLTGGLHVGGDVSGDVDGDAVGDVHTGDSHHADSAFQLISINSFTAFLMMFGWIGLAASRQFGLGALPALFCAFGAGSACMFLTALFFKLAMGLASPGQRFQIEKAVGLTAAVYQRIPAQGRGKIQVSVAGVCYELEASAEERQEIGSFQRVKVVRVVDPRTVSVEQTD